METIGFKNKICKLKIISGDFYAPFSLTNKLFDLFIKKKGNKVFFNIIKGIMFFAFLTVCMLLNFSQSNKQTCFNLLKNLITTSLSV